MSENTTDNDIFINTYLRKQEEFSTELIRKRLELEVKLQFIQVALNEKTNLIDKLTLEKNTIDDMLKQAITGIEALKLEKDNLNSKLDTTITEYENKIRALREINISQQSNTRELHDLKTELTKYKNDNEILKSNYETVKKSFENLNIQLQEKVESNIKTKKIKKSKESEWIDGSNI